MTFNIPNSNGSTFRSNVNSALNTLQGEIGSGGGGYNHQFTANQLVDNQITITHGLNQQFPDFKLYSNGIALSDTSYTAIATDANNLQLAIPSPLHPEPSLLLHFDGDNNSTIFTDDSSNNFLTVPSGGVVISTEQSKFGGASAYFSGGTSRISIPVGLSDAFNLGPDDFTIAFWINPSSIPSYYSTLISGDDSGGYDIPFISLWPNGIIHVGSRAQADPELETSTNNITASSWHHIAVTKDKGTLRIFIDGMISGTHSNSTISYNFGFGGQVNIGLWGLEDTPYSGYMDDLVVIKGTSLYNSTFTPPTAPFLPGGSFNIAVR